MEEEEKQEKDWCELINSKVEEQIKSINEVGIEPSNIQYLSELVDIHKDLANEKYWKEKIDMYRNSGNYGNYGEYGNYNEGSYNEYNEGSYGRRGVPGSGRGRYRESSYGRRGVDAKYRGEEMMDNMYQGYREYSEGRDNYGADQATLQSLDKMLQSTKDFMKMLKKEAKSQEEIEMIKETAREISEM